jgi:hypothetical protein
MRTLRAVALAALRVSRTYVQAVAVALLANLFIPVTVSITISIISISIISISTIPTIIPVSVLSLSAGTGDC